MELTKSEIQQRIVQHENLRDKAFRECLYHDSEIYRLQAKLKEGMSQEECSRIAGLIGSNLPIGIGYVEEIPEGCRGFGKYKYRVMDRYGYPIHHTDSRKDADKYLEKCRAFWLPDYKPTGE